MAKRFHRLNSIVGTEVLMQHGFMCADCGSPNDLCVHHKKPILPEDAGYNNPDNLTVLCRSCHMAHHRRQGHIKPHTHYIPKNPYGRRGKAEPIKCECGELQHAKGLCKKHYEAQFRRARKEVHQCPKRLTASG